MAAYIVTSGEYSDYSIDRVFSTKEKAKELIKAQGDTFRYRVEEWPVDITDAAPLLLLIF